MNNKNKLSKVIYEIFFVRKIKSISMMAATDLMKDKFSEFFPGRGLYLHIHHQFVKLEEYGYLKKKPEGKKLKDAKFEVTAKFTADKFRPSKITKFDDAAFHNKTAHNKNLHDFWFAMGRELSRIEEDIRHLSIQEEELKRILFNYSAYSIYVKELYDEIHLRLKNAISRSQAIKKIMNQRLEMPT